VVILLTLALLTHRQLNYWSDSVRLWQHTLAVTDGNYIAHDNLAVLLMGEGQGDAAVAHYRAALAIYPADPFSNLALAVFAETHGNYQEAIARYERLISITPVGPARAAMCSRQGLVYLEISDRDQAQASFREAVAMDSNNVQGWLGLGVMAEQSGELQQAISDYRHANEARPLKSAYLMLARVLEKTGDTAGASAARQAAKLLPDEERTTTTFSGGILQK